MVASASSGKAASGMSRQRLTALRLVEAFNKMDVDTINDVRHPDCVRYIQPQSMGHQPQTNEAYKRVLKSLLTVFHNFELRLDDLVEDLPARKICLWLTARGNTDVGEYVNEYVWNIEFDESGDKIIGWKEFTDASMKDFFPKLRAAYEAKARSKQTETSPANAKVETTVKGA